MSSCCKEDAPLCGLRDSLRHRLEIVRKALNHDVNKCRGRVLNEAEIRLFVNEVLVLVCDDIGIEFVPEWSVCGGRCDYIVKCGEVVVAALETKKENVLTRKALDQSVEYKRLLHAHKHAFAIATDFFTWMFTFPMEDGSGLNCIRHEAARTDEELTQTVSFLRTRLQIATLAAKLVASPVAVGRVWPSPKRRKVRSEEENDQAGFKCVASHVGRRWEGLKITDNAAFDWLLDEDVPVALWTRIELVCRVTGLPNVYGGIGDYNEGQARLVINEILLFLCCELPVHLQAEFHIKSALPGFADYVLVSGDDVVAVLEAKACGTRNGKKRKFMFVWLDLKQSLGYVAKLTALNKGSRKP